MVKFLGYSVLAIGFVGLLVFLSFLFAYPTFWLVTYLFTTPVITFLFGTFTVYKAWALNLLTSFLFKSYHTTTKD